MTKNVIILGGGAVGSVLAAALSENPRTRTTLISRGKHQEVINNFGLKIAGDKKQQFRLSCRERIEGNLDHTLVIVATKATALKTTIKQILPYIKNTTRFLLVQNGLGISDTVLSAGDYGIINEQIYRGIVGFGATFFEAGLVEYWQGKLILEDKLNSTPFSDIFSDTFLLVHNSANIDKLIWKKVIINSIYNPLSVILKVRNNIIASSQFNGIKNQLLKEGLMIASSEGVNIDLDLNTLNNIVSSNNITSMLQDFIRGKPCEIDFINGAITKIAKKNGISAPVNEFITQTIKTLESIQTQGLAIN